MPENKSHIRCVGKFQPCNGLREQPNRGPEEAEQAILEHPLRHPRLGPLRSAQVADAAARVKGSSASRIKHGIGPQYSVAG